MRDHGVGFVPVVDGSGHVIGTVTDRDLAIRVLANESSPRMPVESVMSTRVLTCKPWDPLAHAEERMMRYKKSRIVCVDEWDRPVGVISLSDIADVERGMRSGEVLRSITQREARGS
jgi:CBS domain-containing protein